MSFRDNLQHLRATRNMTQEQLAVLVGVSRQSVTKWEAERAYPEMDKLLKLCQIFDCTLDELVQGDLTAREEEPGLAVPTAALAEDVVGYDEHFHSYALRLSAGVGLCIAGAGCSATAARWFSDGVSMAALAICVAAGLLLIIPATMEHAAFKRAHPYVASFYTDEQLIAERRTYGVRLAVGIAAIMCSVALQALVEEWGGSLLADGTFLYGVALGVALIVYASILNNRLDVEDYNISALEELSEEEIAGIVGEERAAAVLAKVRRNKRKGSVCGIIMLVATAIAVSLLFWATNAGSSFWSAFFWLPWMVGGLACAVACVVIDQRA